MGSSNHQLNTFRVGLVVLSALLMSMTELPADSEVLEFGGHLYQHIDSRVEWWQAQACCENWNGHLVTLGSAEENEFVFDNFVAPGNLPWIGATDEGSAGDWRWVTGEPWAYANWAPWAPTDYCDKYHCANWATFGAHMQDVWYNDVIAARTFICEWDAEPPERVLTFAHFGTGGGLQFDLVLINPYKTVSAKGTIRFWDPHGAAIDPSGFLPGGAAFELPPRGTKTFSTTGAGSIVTGSITVQANLPLAGVVRFFLPNAGLTGVESSEPYQAVVVPVRREGRLSSGVAIRSTGNASATVDLTLKDEDGNVVINGTARRDIPANGRVSEFVEQYFPDADTASFTGTMLIEVRGGFPHDVAHRVAVIGLELETGDETPKFTTLPVQPVAIDELRPDPTPRRPEDWSSKVVVSKIMGTHTDSPDLNPEDNLYVDFAVLNHGTVAMNNGFQTDLLVDDVVVSTHSTDPPLEPDGWVYWQDVSIGKLGAGPHAITVLVHGVPGSGDHTDSIYTRFITVRLEVTGTWSGTTGQERPLSFDVEDGQVTLVTLDVRVEGPGCTTTVKGSIRLTPGAPITGNSFEWHTSDPWGTAITLSGTFDSSSTASGTLTVVSQGCGSTTTPWSATKN